MKRIMVNILFNAVIILNFCSVVLAGSSGQLELGPTAEATLIEITQILLLVGAAVCVGKVIHIGILYVTSSAVDKSNAKQAILPWLIGTFVCFGAATIGGYIVNVFKIDKPVLSY